MSWISSGESSFSLSSGCPARMMRITFRPAAYCSIRKPLMVAMSSAFFILKGENPNCTSTDCRNSTAVTCVWLICAITTSESSWRRKLSISVVLPAPISPVMTTKPSVNQMVDSMYAFARACARDRNRNCGSGLSRNGNSRSLKFSRYMAAQDITGKQAPGACLPGVVLPFCEPGRAVYARQDPECPQVPLARGGLVDRDVPEFAPRTRRLAVVVPVQGGLAQQLVASRHRANEVDHGGVSPRARAAERQAR